MTLYRRDRREFEVNFSAFHSTFPVETPTCSAQDLERYQQHQQLVHKSSALHLVSIDYLIPFKMREAFIYRVILGN